MKKLGSWLLFVRKRPYLFAALGVVLLIILWSVFGKGGGEKVETMALHAGDFTATISIAGNVIAAKEVEMGFAQSGRVTGVYASVGERVAQGKTLANIENGDERASLQSARARLSAATEGTRPEEIAISQADVSNDKAALVDAVNDAYRTADDAVRTKTAQIFNNPENDPTLTFITENSSAKQTAQAGREDLEDVLLAWEKRLASLSASSNLSVETAHAQSVLAYVAAFLLAVSATLNDAIADNYSTQAKLDAYSSGITTARTNVSAGQSELTSAKASLDQSEKNLALDLAGSRSTDIQIEQAAVAAAEAELMKTLIVAPFAGIITKMDAKVGEIVSANSIEVSMISEGRFQIESYIPEVIIAQVQVGNKAQVYLDAYGEGTPFEATIVSIEPAETERDGVSTYKTILQFNETDERIRPGMTANVTVTTQEKVQALVIPQGALIKRGDSSFVKVMVGNEVEEREVKTGLISVGQIEIVSGLRDGDTVVLNP